jgi:hypothetical protein
VFGNDRQEKRESEKRESEIIHRGAAEHVLSDFTAQARRTQGGKAATKPE